MATYVIGDIHGCYEQLQQLLELIKFNPQHDYLWSVGDLINGGPQPVEVLRLLKSLDHRLTCVLGNHDLYFLGVAYGQQPALYTRGTGFAPILDAPDKTELVEWLRKKPLLHFDETFNTILVHAGLVPQWDLATCLAHAIEVQNNLRGANYLECLANIHGNLPDTWHNNLSGWDRIRYIVNAFARIRFCAADGTLELNNKQNADHAPTGLLPWYLQPNRLTKNINVIFGHWSSLRGNVKLPRVYALDTGCMWGGQLTAMRLEDKKLFAVQNPIAYNE